MLRSQLYRRLLSGALPLSLAAFGVSAEAEDVKQAQMQLPQTYATTADNQEPLRLHTNLGVMGEVELVRERYNDGAIRIERQVTLDRDGNYVNHGEWTMYAPNGDVTAQGQYQFGKRVGTWTRWHNRDDSSIFAEFPFDQFKAPFVSQANFADGEMEGEWTIVDSNNRKMNQIMLQAGHRNGTAITWLPNGKIYWQAQYENAVPVGDTVQMDRKTGDLKRVASYVDGRKITTRTTNHSGTKSKKTESTYLTAATTEKTKDDFWNLRMAKYTTEGKDLRHGVAKAWYTNGKIEQEGNYDFGKKSGTFTYWHENGQVAATGDYKADVPVGTWSWWHENGQKSTVGRYEKGELSGDWRWWNEAGKLTKQHTYNGATTVTSQEEEKLDVGQKIDDFESIF
jgi:antitoxin component YwqK of YwqJK toxin-antitoxin module